MGNNNLKGTNDILVKVDQNNLIYIDPNSIVSNGQIQPRGVEPENLVMFINLEADLVPRTTLIANGDKNTLVSIARGTLNFLQNKQGTDYDTKWTDVFVNQPVKNINTSSSKTEPVVDTYRQNDETAQTFGIESISIKTAGANFIPKVDINFIDVRGKTLFDSPINSPYSAFFHLPWPIFYLTVKGYYGKAIRYRLHLVKFNSRYNSETGNFEVQTNFVGSTYAYLADISLESILNAPYFYISESEQNTQYDEKTGRYTKKVSKSTKGYRVLKSVYQEYINKGYLPPNFPVRTLREIIIIAGRLNKILESRIYDKVVDPKILSGVKDFETLITQFYSTVEGWQSRWLSLESFTFGGTPTQWYQLAGQNKNTTEKIIGKSDSGTLELILNNYILKLEQNTTFGSQRKPEYIKDKDLKINTISFASVKNVKDFYIISDGKIGVNINGLKDNLLAIETNFVQQRTKLEDDIEKKMNDIVSSKDKDIGIGFEPTIRNIIGVVLANAETYVRLMKDVHEKAFNVANFRKKILQNVLTDSDKSAEAIYPWPEIKIQSANGKELVLKYPGSKELINKLQTENAKLWPEIDFVENFYEISTKKADNLTGKEGLIDNIDYVFESDISMDKKDISILTNISAYTPYSNKSISSILYEIYERAKYTTSFSPFDAASIRELANIEFYNLQTQLADDIDVVDILKTNVTDVQSLILQMQASDPYNKFPYYEDQIPTTPYIKESLNQDFAVQKYIKKPINDKASDYKQEYSQTSDFLSKYISEPYRQKIYPFNSSTYLPYIGQTGKLQPKSLYLNGLLTINTPDEFIVSPLDGNIWAKEDYYDNLFINTVKIGGEDKHLLNTPYFHQQLYRDFVKTQSQEKYAGSAYLLLNSLPFKDLDDTITYSQKSTSTLVSTLFREIGATHYIPYHLMLKWGSIYHRYKKYINGDGDILAGITSRIDGDLFYDNYSGRTYTGCTSPIVQTVIRSDSNDVGFHPFYEAIFHQIVNGYPFYNATSTGATENYTKMLLSGVTKGFYRNSVNMNTWTSFIDNSKFNTSDGRYTILPSNGYTDIYDDDFIRSEQENFRIIWGIGVNGTTPIDYTGYTFPLHNEYFKSTSSIDTFSMSDNYRKVIDLIATFKPDILDVFEHAFLDFASEKLNEEIVYKAYDMTYAKFQDLLKQIVSVTKKSGDSSSIDTLMNDIRDRQISGLQDLTSQILSSDNLIKISMGNPREIDNYVLGGFTRVNVANFVTNLFNIIQVTPNLDNIKLYLGEDIDGYYVDFFSSNDIELSEENIFQFRSLIYIYAGLRADGMSYNDLTKQIFVDYLKNNILNTNPIFQQFTGVYGQDARLYNFLTQLIGQIPNLKTTTDEHIATIKRGYNDDPVKLELYNYFKSFNDKWTAGNSIGQRTLMEEFLFLDKANRDIGSSVYIDMERLRVLGDKPNYKINLFSLISLLVQDSGFDIRVLPAYVNFYGTNYSNTKRITPSKNVARNMFGTFLDVDYEDSSPKIILQYIGPTSKHLEMSDINKNYKYKNDGFNIGDVNRNPVIVAPDIFTQTDFTKSNKVVAFEVSFGDQNQSIFKGVELDQTSIKNTSESFVVLERLGQSETGSSTAQVDVGLFDIYRQSSYQCTVTAMGNAMIQPTMYFYLKNIPLFRGSYWITEVTHSIRPNGIITQFKGTRIPQQSLPNPEDSFLASYRALFDRLVRKAVIQSQAIDQQTTTEKTIRTEFGSFTYDLSGKTISGEVISNSAGVTIFGIPYNGFDDEKYIQKVAFKDRGESNEWLRGIVTEMGTSAYPITDDTEMSIISRLTVSGVDVPKTINWGSIKNLTSSQDFYSTKFNLRRISADDIVNKYPTTIFLNPNKSTRPTLTLKTNIRNNEKKYFGPINIGPSINGYGIGMSKSLMNKLGLFNNQVVYFRLLPK